MNADERQHDEASRYRAAQQLVQLHAPALYEQARELMADESWRVRRAAWQSLLDVARERQDCVQFLLDCLEDEGNASLRGAALDALLHSGSTAIGFLLEELGRRGPRVQKFILDILIQVHAQPGADLALRLLSEADDENLRFAAAELLGAVGQSSHAVAVLERLERLQGTDRFAALSAVAQIVRRDSTQLSVSRIIPLLDDPIAFAPALELLGLCGGPEAGELLWARIQPGWRIDASIYAMGEFIRRHPEFRPASSAEGVATILDRCRGGLTKPGIEEAAFDIIARLEPARLPALSAILAQRPHLWLPTRLAQLTGEQLMRVLPALSTTDHGRRALAQTLMLRPDVDGEPVLLSLLSQPGEHRVEVLRALGVSGGTRALPHLVAMCAAPEEEVADQAAEALLQMAARGIEGLPATLGRAAETATPTTLVRLLPAIGRIAAPELVGVLAMAMRHPEAYVRRTAVAAASRQALVPELASVLRARLADEDDEVRAAAAQALGEAGASWAIEALEVLLDDPSPWVQAAALRALVHLGCVPMPARLIELMQRGGVVATIAAGQVGRYPETFGQWVELLARLDADAAAELVHALTNVPDDLPSDVLASLLAHPAWPVRSAAADYIAARRRPWMIELARQRLSLEADTLVRSRLEGVAGG